MVLILVDIQYQSEEGRNVLCEKNQSQLKHLTKQPMSEDQNQFQNRNFFHNSHNLYDLKKIPLQKKQERNGEYQSPLSI